MKKIVLSLALVCLLFAAPVMAGETSLVFQWGQEISEDFAGWKLYKADAPGVMPGPDTLFATIPYGGTEQTDYESMQPMTSPDGQDVYYYFVLTAFDTDGNESGPSNEVEAKIDFQSPEVPFTFRVQLQRN